MAKKQVKAYFLELEANALRDQLMDLYEKFPQVKEYYDFALAPKEDKLILAAKERVSKEYFPINGRRPKARRSIANNLIKKFKLLSMDPTVLAEFMFFNVQLMQTFVLEHNKPDAFYKSMGNAFRDLTRYLAYHGLLENQKEQVLRIYKEAVANQYPFLELFSDALNELE